MKGLNQIIKWALLLFAAIVAVFTGLQAYYFGKAFGAPQDYIAMLLLGGGAQAAIAGLIVAAERLINRD